MGIGDFFLGSKEEVSSPDYGMYAALQDMFKRGRGDQIDLLRRTMRSTKRGLKGKLKGLKEDPIVPGDIARGVRREMKDVGRQINMGEAGRGFYTTSVPGTRTAAATGDVMGNLYSQFGGQRTADIAATRGALRNLRPEFLSALAGVKEQYPAGYASVLGAQGAMAMDPRTVQTAGQFGTGGSFDASGILGQGLGALTSAFGTQVGTGLTNLFKTG
jgi:hypothetical protein